MNDFAIVDEPLPGVVIFNCPHYRDIRGSFIKHFCSDYFQSQGIFFHPAESFLTRSRANVIRGMHFQVGEAAHEKLIFCPKGRVLDVVVCICPKSPHFNKPISVELSEHRDIGLIIGKGYGHGFLSLDDDSWMMYSTTSVHCPSLDRGVLWSSINFDWPIQDPIISKRDRQHPLIGSLQSR